MFEEVVENLKKRDYEVSCFSTAEEAAAYLNEQIDGQTVGFGGSMSLREMEVFESLGTHNTVYRHDGEPDPEKRKEILQHAIDTAIYVSSVNGLSKTGEVINIDGTCNRVSATLFGHEKVYLVVGKNKLADDYDSALWRARNIAAPKNAQRLGRKTPCALKGDHCYDCDSPERICRALVVFWRKPQGCAMEIVLVDQDLGY